MGITPGAQAGRWTPAIDFEQCDGHLVVIAELPGLKGGSESRIDGRLSRHYRGAQPRAQSR
jgi:HSP20 family molecular chaperone IbpA